MHDTKPREFCKAKEVKRNLKLDEKNGHTAGKGMTKS
jgi:hypothetical protein